MRRESFGDIKAFTELYDRLVERYNLLNTEESYWLKMRASFSVGECSYFSSFIKDQNMVLGNLDRRYFIDFALEKLCEFEKLILTAEKGEF